MAGIVKQVAGVLAGIILCILIIMAVEMLGHMLLTGEAVFMAPILAYLLAATVGGIAAMKVAGLRRWWLPGIIAAFLAFGIVMNLGAMAHPLWFAPAAALALIAGFYASWRLSA
ncbi:hypothetical protein [Niveispirillum sp.]|uniref:hypothetical protein n=1 Tax=Niveispirillum sp. TaxID=1917217 RepID=UPI001B701C3B|nr:hypothetical protein [Niveispirillum sp.]MBP7336096.1 hypothetical protein [Niveispirillum sp.]